MRELPPILLERLTKGLPAISPAFGAFLVEAATVCLEQGQHLPSARWEILGDLPAETQLQWAGELSDQVRNSWRDLQEATEYGATCLALLLVLALTDLTVVRRAVKGTGFDYWLGFPDQAEDGDFQACVRLEISGILSGDNSTIKKRVMDKLRQTQRSDHLGLPALVIVTEFRTLLSHFESK